MISCIHMMLRMHTAFDNSKPICAAESLGRQRHLLAAHCHLVDEHWLLKRGS